MALVINDRVKESSSTSGTGTIALAGAVQGSLLPHAILELLVLHVSNTCPKL